MIIDHLGYILPESNYIFRFFGRAAFPIFAFVLAHNIYYFSSSLPKMILKLFLFGIITQPFAILTFPGGYGGTLNILFSFMGSSLFICGHKLEKNNLQYPIYLFAFFISMLSDYGIFGAFLSYSIYLFFEKKKIIYLFVATGFSILSEIHNFPFWVVSGIFIAPLIIILPDKIFTIKRSPKNLFYFLYVFQFILLYLIFQT